MCMLISFVLSQVTRQSKHFLTVFVVFYSSYFIYSYSISRGFDIRHLFEVNSRIEAKRTRNKRGLSCAKLSQQSIKSLGPMELFFLV